MSQMSAVISVEEKTEDGKVRVTQVLILGGGQQMSNQEDEVFYSSNNEQIENKLALRSGCTTLSIPNKDNQGSKPSTANDRVKPEPVYINVNKSWEEP